ncbi:MAG: hypothetical protein ACK55Z_02870, partial [bacterium]
HRDAGRNNTLKGGSDRTPERGTINDVPIVQCAPHVPSRACVQARIPAGGFAEAPGRIRVRRRPGQQEGAAHQVHSPAGHVHAVHDPSIHLLSGPPTAERRLSVPP